MRETVRRSGVAIIKIEAEHPDRVRVYADDVKIDSDGRIHVRHHNAYVRSGLRNALLREAGIGGTSVAGIGVSANTTAVTGDTRFLNGATAGLNGAVTGQTVCIKALSPAMSIVTDGAGVAQKITGGATFQNSDFNGSGFVWNKLGWTLAVPASNASEVDGNLVDVIGGVGGTSPYNKTFSIDLTGAGTYVATLQIEVTATAV